MKVLLLGSSLVYHLGVFDKTWRHTLDCGRKIKFLYKGFSGWSYEEFLGKRGQRIIDSILSNPPDIIITILGANSIKTNVDKSVVLRNTMLFYKMLNEKFLSINPEGIIIASQLPLRFVTDPDNKHFTPDPETFKYIRDKVNTKLCNLKYKHHVLSIGGKGKLDNESLFKDGIHFNNTGLKIQLFLIKRKLYRVLNPEFYKQPPARRQ